MTKRGALQRDRGGTSLAPSPLVRETFARALAVCMAGSLMGAVSTAQQLSPPPNSNTPSPTNTLDVGLDRATAPLGRLDGTMFVGAADFDPTGLEREAGAVGVGLILSGRISDRTRMNVSFVRGPADIVSALTLPGLFRATARATWQHPAWNLVAGDFTSANHALAGPIVRADGVSLGIRRRIVAEITAGRPKYFGGGSGGHVAQAKLGVRIPIGTIALVGSDLSRPLASTTISGVTVTSVQSQETVTELDTLRRLLSRESAVRGVGLESDLRWGTGNAFLVRAGELRLSDHAGQTSRGAAGEARYTYTRGRASLNAYARRTPASLIGTYVPGDALSAGGRVPLLRSVNAVAYAYSNANWLIGQSQPVRSEGGSLGLDVPTGPVHVTVQINQRRLRSSDSRFDSDIRTVSGRASRSLGVVQFDGGIEVGSVHNQPARRAVQMYRARISIGPDEGPSVWLAASYNDYAIQPPRSRADVGFSASIRRWQFETGAGYGTGQVLGNATNAWVSLEAPLPAGLTLVGTADYLRWDFAASPYIKLLVEGEPMSPWRIGIGVRRNLSLPIPFMHHDSTR